ncbi:diguanylate cyclase [Neiella marina]|uniref:Diguanylate cyclase n=1 Tax=Neiella holothuriorum TaxID=2870530 RepID=A0ABS7ECM0_9GAMM|nr:diguanylate cyclase [Neiella holothuriorum]MBW8190086.1 diguanylate cyclase [Neiella holothuriorum]
MRFRYKPPFVSLRWQVAVVLVASSTIAVLALLLWASAESKDDLKRRILTEQQHLIADLRNASKQGFNLLADRANQLEAFLPLASDQTALEKLALGFQASLVGSQGQLIAGRALPDDQHAKQWVNALLKNGGEYRRWYCQDECELQYFSMHESGSVQLIIQHIVIDELMAKLNISHVANLWLVGLGSQPNQLFYQTTELPEQLQQNTSQLPLPPHYVLVGQHRPQATWRWPLQNDGVPAELWVAMPTQHSMTSVQQVWQKTTLFIVATLVICCILAIGLIWRPLLRLSKQSKQLPLLATANLPSVKPAKNKFLRDESHLFATACHELSEKLLEQRQRLLQQTHELQRLAQHDQLTGLNNRSMFEQSLQQTIGQLGRHIQSLAVMFMDLDKFKQVNDTLGHEKGDQLLQQVAMRLASLIRKSDMLARFGGDEFVVLLTEPGDNHQLKLLAEKLISIVNEPVQLSKETAQVGLSVGITVCTDPQCSIDQLLREADAAMYSAKRSGTSKACFFHATLNQQQAGEQLVEDSLLRAIAHQTLSLQFQPFWSTADQRPAYFQAHLNWPGAPVNEQGNQASAQIASPDMQQQLHEWLLQHVLDLIDQQHGSMPPNFRLFIQGASCSLQQPELLRQVVLCCRRDPQIANHFGLFIDEQIYIEHAQNFQMELNVLHQLGVGIALDRFGNGLGALNQLSQCPPTLVRLDDKFCHGDSLINGVTESLVKMLHKMHIQVLACGVDDKDSLVRLHHLGCDLVQGRYFGNLLLEHQFSEQLAQQNNL